MGIPLFLVTLVNIFWTILDCLKVLSTITIGYSVNSPLIHLPCSASPQYTVGWVPHTRWVNWTNCHHTVVVFVLRTRLAKGNSQSPKPSTPKRGHLLLLKVSVLIDQYVFFLLVQLIWFPTVAISVWFSGLIYNYEIHISHIFPYFFRFGTEKHNTNFACVVIVTGRQNTTGWRHWIQITNVGPRKRRKRLQTSMKHFFQTSLHRNHFSLLFWPIQYKVL